MRVLLDTHLLLWAAEGRTGTGEELPVALSRLLLDTVTIPVFSAISILEVAIKSGLGRPDFAVNPQNLRRGLMENGWEEMPVTGRHAAAVAALPPIHKDPFDRLLVAQATIEGITLVTADGLIARYPGPIRRL